MIEKQQSVTMFNSPYLEDLANGFTTWLAKKLNGRLPAPRVRVVGASEEFWPFLRDPSLAINPASTENTWATSDACMFAFMAVGANGEVKRLDRKTKRGMLPAFFPFDRKQIGQLSRYDAAVFLRLKRMPNTQHQIAVACEECCRVLELWMSKPLVLAGPNDGPDAQVMQWISEFATEAGGKNVEKV